MNKELKVSKSIVIDAKAENVWDVLVNPEKIKVYLFGTETLTDWKEGSPIVFQGVYDGTSYKDKGKVIEVKLNKCLKYNYWACFSGLEDKLENYSNLTYLIEEHSENQVTFTWTQEGFANEKGCEHTAEMLGEMLDTIKKLAEDY